MRKIFLVESIQDGVDKRELGDWEAIGPTRTVTRWIERDRGKYSLDIFQVKLTELGSLLEIGSRGIDVGSRMILRFLLTPPGWQ